MKFKVGDKVRIIGKSTGESLEHIKTTRQKGVHPWREVGTIISIRPLSVAYDDWMIKVNLGDYYLEEDLIKEDRYKFEEEFGNLFEL